MLATMVSKVAKYANFLTTHLSIFGVFGMMLLFSILELESDKSLLMTLFQFFLKELQNLQDNCNKIFSDPEIPRNNSKAVSLAKGVIYLDDEYLEIKIYYYYLRCIKHTRASRSI